MAHDLGGVISNRVPRSLTETSKVASEQLLNRDFERHFTEECKTLRASSVTLQFPGRQGQSPEKSEVILQKDAYGGRSLQHNRLAKKQPERCAGEDEGLFAVLFDEFARRAEELPLLFDPRASEVALRPSVAALKRCISLLSGTVAVKGQEAASDEIFTAPDTLGWTYQYWNIEEKERVFEKVRTKKGSRIEGAEIIPATCIYTEPYMVKFLVQNSLGAIWMGIHPDSMTAACCLPI